MAAGREHNYEESYHDTVAYPASTPDQPEWFEIEYDTTVRHVVHCKTVDEANATLEMLHADSTVDNIRTYLNKRVKENVTIPSPE